MRHQRGRGFPESGAQMKGIQESWEQDLTDQIYPLGPYVDLEGLTNQVWQAFSDEIADMDFYFEVVGNYEEYRPNALQMVKTVTGLSGEGIQSAGSVEAAAGAYKRANKLLDWIKEGQKWTDGRCPESYANVVAWLEDRPDGEWYMVRRFRNRRHASHWLTQVRREAHRILPFGLNAWEAWNAEEAGEIVLRSGPSKPRKAAVVYAAALFELTRHNAMLAVAHARGESGSKRRTLSSFSYGSALRDILPECWASWRDEAPSLMARERRTTRAAIMFGRRPRYHELLQISDERMEQAQPFRDDIIAAYRGLRRAGVGCHLRCIIELFVIAQPPLARRLLQTLALGENAGDEVMSRMPPRPLSPEDSRRLAESPDDPLAGIEEVSAWSGFGQWQLAS